MIVIYNVHIDEKQIVGIGPLMVRKKCDLVGQAYQERSYYFELYLTNYRIVVSTDPLSNDNTERAKQEHSAIVAAHKAVLDGLLNGSLNALCVGIGPQTSAYNE